MSECKVSVIVPVYNAQQHLATCLKCLCAQTLQECEFIIVNDGSTDDSLQIAESFRLTDRRIRLINQPNRGVSAARNTGLEAAAGAYIGFADADDEIAPDMYERLYETAEQFGCDVVFSDFVSEKGKHSVVSEYPFPGATVLDGSYIRRELMTYLLKADDLNTVWTKLYKADPIRRHGIAFPAGVPLGEDGLFNLRYFSHAQTAVYLRYAGYRYKETAGSATRSPAAKDYFARALEVYAFESPELGLIDSSERVRLKSIKLIDSVLACIHIYFAAADDLPLAARCSYVRRMIGHTDVQSALAIYAAEKGAEGGRYRSFLLGMIRRESVWRLYLATAYSRWRNR